MRLKEAPELGLTFDDVLLMPRYSEVLPRNVCIKTQLTRRLTLNLPLVSAAMDTVTEYETAICMAQEGGIGMIHKNMTIADQIQQVQLVKRSESGMIIDPISISPEQPVHEAMKLMQQHRISGVPVTQGKELVGILTNRDLRFETNFDQQVQKVMTKGRERLVTVAPGIDLEEAKALLHSYRIEKLLVVSDYYELVGLITIKDIEKARKYPDANRDQDGRLRVGAAIGTTEDQQERVQSLINVGVDVLVLDSAHGHSLNVIESVRRIRSNFPDAEIIAGNIVSEEAALALIDAGADGLKVGIGPGSICTTRIIAGVGVPQITAIQKVVEVAQRRGIPVVADGGVKFSGDIVKALAAGAHSVMIGSLLAGTKETPGEVILYQGRQYKLYRGMGSLGAMRKGSKDRYHQSHVEDLKLVPEGIEGRVPYKGELADTLHQFAGGLRAGMGYTGCRDIEALRTETEFIRITPAGLKESHVHDIFITEESPNYPLSTK